MADDADKTEKPTPKKLQDARDKGDVPKSKEVSSTVGLLMWLALGSMVVTFATTRIAALFELTFKTISEGWAVTGFAGAARSVGSAAAEIGILMTAVLIIPAAIVGLLAEFLQTGPILTFEKLIPSLEKLNPVEGVKKMFTMDNAMELLKSIVKAVLLLAVGWFLIKTSLPEVIALARSPDLPAQRIGDLMWSLTFKAVAWPVGLMIMIAILDVAWQRYSFEKKMRMSMHDIKEEMKESEGDPHVKGQRKQLQREWSQQQSNQAARGAAVLVVNPTHVAIAIDYDRELNPVPSIAAKGEDDVAMEMRRAAEDAGVPVVRNIPLARDLLARGEVGEIIPADLFDIIAEVILWANDVRKEVDALKNNELSAIPRQRPTPPGEDLTHYPESPWNPSP